MNLKRVSTTRLQEMWESFKNKRNSNDCLSNDSEGYLTVLQREEMLDALFSRLRF